EKKKMYDMYGSAGVHQHYSQEDIFRGADFSDFEDIFSSFGFSDPFSMFFGSMFDKGFGRMWKERDIGQSREVSVTISLEDVAKGAEKEISYKRYDMCPKCHGTGGKGIITCPMCHGTGMVKQVRRMGPMHLTTTTICPKCHGTGKIIKDKCPMCHGSGKIEKIEKLTINIPKGVEDGMRLRLAGMGDYGKDGYGDCYVYVKVKPDKVFKREGKDLLMEYHVNIAQAIMGDKVKLKDIYGKEFELKIPEGVQSGDVIIVNNRGLPGIRRGKGDLKVKIIVDIPKARDLTREQREMLRKMFKMNKKKFLGFFG
ncbi:molecular chaperone DnaJ, partial [Candidatus Micrarchaeota archaeon]|nr:molecular chaperone DnaJ [Candidatus Micrarchaeota archaeon]